MLEISPKSAFGAKGIFSKEGKSAIYLNNLDDGLFIYQYVGWSVASKTIYVRLVAVPKALETMGKIVKCRPIYASDTSKMHHGILAQGPSSRKNEGHLLASG